MLSYRPTVVNFAITKETVVYLNTLCQVIHDDHRCFSSEDWPATEQKQTYMESVLEEMERKERERKKE